MDSSISAFRGSVMDLTPTITDHVPEQDSEQDSEQVFDITRVPQEIEELVWKFALIPRNIIVQHIQPNLVEYELKFRRGEAVDPPKCQFEIDPSYTQPTTLSVSRKSRTETLLRYSRILASGIPDSWVYFNFDIDTLTLNPYSIRRWRFERPMYYVDNGIRFQKHDVIPHHGEPFFSFGLLKGLLERDNNLARVQSLALGNFRWEDLKNADRVAFLQHETMSSKRDYEWLSGLERINSGIQ
jgi:hypothetical protein